MDSPTNFNRYSIFPEYNLVYIMLSGQNAMSDFVAFLMTIPSDPDFRPEMRYLINARSARPSGNSSNSEKSVLSDFSGKVAGSGPKVKVATIVSNSLEFGLTRMYEHEFVASFLDNKVFLEADEALDWLDLGPDIAEILEI